MEQPCDVWLSAREQHRQILFGENIDVYPAMGNVAIDPLTTLTLYANSRYDPEGPDHLRISEATRNILDHHNEMAKDGKPAIFGIDQPGSLTYVTGLTSEVIQRWEHACRKRNRTPLFANLPTADITDEDFQREDVQLVVETAGAVMEILGLGYRTGLDLTNEQSRKFINLVARRGPAFATAWIRGDIVRDYYASQGEDAEGMLSIVTPAKLAYIAMGKPRDPLTSAVDYIESHKGALRNAPPVKEIATYGTWLDNREQYRQNLFGEHVDVSPMLEDAATAPLATLAFNTRVISRRKSPERLGLTHAAHNILDHQNKMAKDGKEVVFGIGSPGNLDHIANLTAGVMAIWQRTCRKYNRESPFADLPETDVTDEDFRRKDVQLVIETASAVMEVFGMGYKAGQDVTARDFGHFASLVARRGPAFATAWVKGDIIRNHYANRSEDAKELLRTLSPELLIYLERHAMNDPLGAAVSYVEHLNELSVDNLANELGWSKEKVMSAFTPTIRKQIAVRHSTHPLEEIKRIMRNSDELSSENLASILGWSEDEVGELFTPAQIKVVIRRGNPKQAAQEMATAYKDTLSMTNIAKCLGWSEVQCSEVFTPNVRRKIVLRSPRKAIRKVRAVAATRKELIQNFQLPIEIINHLSVYRSAKSASTVALVVQNELNDCPSRTDTYTWAWIVAQKPNATRKEWLERLTVYNAWRRVANPNSLDARVYSDGNPEDIAKDAYDFTETILASEPGDYLQELAAKAEIPYERLHSLMASFNQDEAELKPGDLATLEKLRSTIAS